MKHSLSYDVTVIQWITSSYKSYEHPCNNTLARTRNVNDIDRVSNAFSYWNNVRFDGDKIPFQKVIW